MQPLRGFAQEGGNVSATSMEQALAPRDGSHDYDGTMTTPLIGEFKDGIGKFYKQETYKGRSVLLQGVWSDITPDSHTYGGQLITALRLPRGAFEI